jgi:hypothetical protein
MHNNRNITRKGSKDNGNKVDRHSKEYSIGVTTDQPVEGRFERTSCVPLWNLFLEHQLLPPPPPLADLSVALFQFKRITEFVWLKASLMCLQIN